MGQPPKEQQAPSIRIAICDDDPKARALLMEFVQRFAHETGRTLNLLSFCSGEELLATDDSKIDLLFLDIQMGGLDGMATAHALRERNQQLHLVFATNYEQYAIEGYEVAAFRFLKKPVDYSQFCEIAAHVVLAIEKEHDTVAIQGKEGVFHVRLADIVYCETFNRRALLHTRLGDIECQQSMAELAKALGRSFFRCHTSYLVNFKHISQLGADDLGLSDGTVIPVSRHRRKDLLQAALNYWGDTLL